MATKRNHSPLRLARALFRRLLAMAGAVALTLAFFLVLPLMQTLTQRSRDDLDLRVVETAQLEPPPPPPMQEEQEEEPEPEEEPPELDEPAQPLDLEQLAMALNPGFGDGGFSGDFAVNLDVVAQKQGMEELFSIADLDQRPRAVYQASPAMSAELRRKAPGTVYIIFIVDERGRVENPQIQDSTDPAFERPALNAVRQWRFEPGKRSGKPVRFRMRVPITFPKG